MDFELLFPEGLEHMNRVVSTDPSGLNTISHESDLEFEHLWAWYKHYMKERERQLQEALQNEDYERAAELRDELGRKAR